MTGRLPHLAGWLVRRSGSRALADDVLGDLEATWRADTSPRVVATARVLRLACAVYWHSRRDVSRDGGAHRWSWTGGAMQDVRLALRLLARRPRLAVATILTLGLGLGASTAMLTAARSVVRPSLPYPDGSRLVHVWATWPGGAGNFSYPDFEAIRAEVTAFDDVATYESWGAVALGTDDHPIRLTPSFGSVRYLPLLGATPAAGRLLEPADEVPNAEPVVILNHGLWVRQFASDPQVVGRIITLNSAPYRVIGVLNPGLADLGQVEEELPDIYLPVVAARQLLGQPPLTDAMQIYWGVGHLRPGATLAGLQQQLDGVAARMAIARPATHAGHKLQAKPLVEYLHGAIAAPARLLVAGALLMLLIGCANVANLMLARAAERRGEFALRVAIGASRGRLVRQALIDSLVIAAAGGVLGGALAIGITSALAGWVSSHVSAFVNPRNDPAALSIAIALTLLTTVAVGVAPALSAARSDLREAVALTGRAGAGLARGRLRAALVVAEVGLAVVLLVGAGLLTRSTERLMSQGIGFPTARLLTFRLDLSGDRYAQPESISVFADRFVRALEALPGVESATMWGPSMLSRATWVVDLLPDDRPFDRPEAFTMAFFHATSPGGLHNLGIALVAGREFSAVDTVTGEPVTVISEDLARQFWPNGGGVGQRLRRSNPSLPMLTVVGIAGDVRHRQRYSLGAIAEGLGPLGLAPQRDLYLPFAQRPLHAAAAAVRVTNPDTASPDLRKAIAAIDPALAIDDIRTLDDRLSEQNQAPAAMAALMGAYAFLAVALAGVGLYSVVAQMVHERTHEIGLRLALGARTGSVRLLVFRHGAWLVIAGVTAGLGASLILSRMIASLLYGVAPTDGVTFAAVPVALAIVALAAMWAPLVRATRIEPVIALRAH